MASFVTTDDYATATQQTITPGSDLEAAVEFALDAACAEIQRVTGQHIEFVAADVIKLDGNCRRKILLPQIPVTAINAVTIDKGLDTEEVVTDWILAQADSGIVYRKKWWPWGVQNLTFDYDHGFAPIPADLMNVAIQAARAGITVSPGGIVSETIGGYSYSRGAVTVGIQEYSHTLDLYKAPRIPVA